MVLATELMNRLCSLFQVGRAECREVVLHLGPGGSLKTLVKHWSRSDVAADCLKVMEEELKRVVV